MISIILAVILGLIFTAVALQNTQVIGVNFLGNSFSVPLFFYTAVAFLAGVFVSFLFHLVDMTQATFNLHRRDTQLRNLQQYATRLESENTELRHRLGDTRDDLREEKVEHTKSNARNFLGRLRHQY